MALPRDGRTFAALLTTQRPAGDWLRGRWRLTHVGYGQYVFYDADTERLVPVSAVILAQDDITEEV